MVTKTLYILRHAKSSWDDSDKDDFDRPLKARGVEDIKILSKEIKEKIDGVDAVFSSPANRAIHTAILFAKAIGIPLERISISGNLYEASILDLQEFVKSLPDIIQSAVIVGHNPTLTDFVNGFIKQQIFNMPTSGFVKLCFKCASWPDISKTNLKSSFFDFPKNHV